MARLPKAREVVYVLLRQGFTFTRQRGSHAIYRHINGTRVTVPVHGNREISPAVFRQILRDLRITAREFWSE